MSGIGRKGEFSDIVGQFRTGADDGHTGAVFVVVAFAPRAAQHIFKTFGHAK